MGLVALVQNTFRRKLGPKTYTSSQEPIKGPEQYANGSGNLFSVISSPE